MIQSQSIYRVCFTLLRPKIVKGQQGFVGNHSVIALFTPSYKRRICKYSAYMYTQNLNTQIKRQTANVVQYIVVVILLKMYPKLKAVSYSDTH